MQVIEYDDCTKGLVIVNPDRKIVISCHYMQQRLFILQSVFCIFAEDVGFLPYGIFTKEVKRVLDGEDNSANVLTLLFKMMDECDRARKKGKYETVRYFNGPLFEVKPEIVLEDDEIEMLYKACQFDWGKIKPEIFGSLFETAMDRNKRHDEGMHYTSEENILKIVKPCIVDYWEDKLKNANTLDKLKDIHQELLNYRILDPACGSGNFLLVAYREAKKIEAKIFRLYSQIGSLSYEKVQQRMGHFSVKNIYGIEFNKFPTFLAKLSLWITKKIVQTEHKFTEEDLPLENLKHISCGDALKLKWDDIDVVIGNPPFLGCKLIRSVRGDEYFNWLSKRFPKHNKMSDYCTYWYQKVAEDVKKGVRVGLVSTNTITQTNSRKASLEKIYDNGGEIFNAISTQKWSGEAKVHVSIVNYVNKGKCNDQKILNGKKVKAINSRLREEKTSKSGGVRINKKIQKLAENKDIAFVGAVLNGKGFLLNLNDGKKLYENKENQNCLKIFITGEDLNQGTNLCGSRYIIDFQNWELQDAKKYKKLFKIVESEVKPQRMAITSNTKDAENYRKYWWKFARPQMKMREKINNLKQVIITSRVSKHPIFSMVKNKNLLPADSTVVFASDDWKVLGILSSKFHVVWYKYQCSTLKNDLRYTNSTIFETFSFPKSINRKVGEIAKKIQQYKESFLKKQSKGQTTLYNELNEGGHEILAKLHQNLDQEVAKDYGLPKAILANEDDIISFLLELNLEKSGNIQEKKIA